MKKAYLLVFCALIALSATASAKEARLIRYPNYNQGRVTFSYLGDVWVADEDGRNVQRLTVNRARDVYPRFSPDGKWIAFSSDRNGNLDVYIIPSSGGTPRQLTFNSAEDSVLGWTPDGARVLFSSGRGESFMPTLYTVSTEGGVRWPSISADGKTIVFEHDFGISKLDVGSKRVTPLHFDISAETEENSAEVRDFNSVADDYDLAPNSRRIVLSVHGEVFTAPVEEGDLRQITDTPARDRDVSYSPDGKWRAYVSDRTGRAGIQVLY